jgi:hypothetical protein
MPLFHALSVWIEFAVASTEACVLSSLDSTEVKPVLRSDDNASIIFCSASISLSKVSILSDVVHRV